MNTAQTFIIKQPLLKDSQNYRLLREIGLKHIEQLAHRLWTDYNVHDPGITILEALCYAITDLGYRTSFDIKDLLTTEVGQKLSDEFHTAKKIFPSHPITFNDLRKVLIDIDGVYNAWITKNQDIKYCIDEQQKLLKESCEQDKSSDKPTKPLNGLFDVLIQFEDFVERRFFGLPLPKLTSLVEENFIETTAEKHNNWLEFKVLKPVHIESVTVISEREGKVVIRLLKILQGDDVTKVTEISAEVKRRVPTTIYLDWRIKTLGDYRIDIVADNAKLKLYHTPNSSLPTIEGLISITNSPQLDDYYYYFFYNWKISDIAEEEPQLDTNNLTEDLVIKHVKSKLYAYRNLCEDFVNIRQLKTEQVSICADIEVRPDADLEDVLSEIYYQLEIHVSPPVQFYTIQELFAKGKTSTEIFDGPTLSHGFIDDDEFRAIERRENLRASDITQIIMGIEGVTAVKSLRLLSFVEAGASDSPSRNWVELPHPDEQGVTQFFIYKEEEWLLELQDKNFFAPDFASDKSKVYFYKNNLPYLANRRVTAQLVAEKRARQIKQKLSQQEQDKDLEVQNGNYRNLSDYYPVQNELPETYFVGNNLVPTSYPKHRHAQSKQLKAYLLFFEQLLANYLAQLSNLPALFSMKKEDKVATYFTQKISEIAEIEQLYHSDYNSGLDLKLEELIETTTVKGTRKNKFLDHLVARFCETFTDYSLLMYSFRHLSKSDISNRLIRDKQSFLTNYPTLSRDRGKGFHYKEIEKNSNLTGFQKRVYGLLGIYNEDYKLIRQNFSNPAILLVREVISNDKESITLYYFQIRESPQKSPLFQSIGCNSEDQVRIQIDTFLAFGANKDNWVLLDINPFTNQKSWVLKRNCVSNKDFKNLSPEKQKDEILGFTTTTIDEFDDFIKHHFQDYANREGFHVVEHTLLRPRAKGDAFLPIELHDSNNCDCVEVTDPYSFRVSVILPSWPIRFKSIRFRQFVEKTLRLEAPAHVYLRICWINHDEMNIFENLQDAWLSAHKNLDSVFRGVPALLSSDEETDHQMKTEITSHQVALNKFVAKLFDLTNIFAVAKIHGCDDEAIDSDEPQISLNNTSLGSL